MYRICKSFEIESGHMLSKHPDKCKFPHGHTRKVEFVLEEDDLDDSGMVCDFKVFKEAIGAMLETYDHAMCMNTDDPMYPVMKERYGCRVIGFESMEPTTEVMAKVFYEEMKERLEKAGDLSYPVRDTVWLLKVRVWETSSCWAEYDET
jgi:6-pyruvoyltetrahydropterin/6-carboxytetrahydropterin synthase